MLRIVVSLLLLILTLSFASSQARELKYSGAIWERSIAAKKGSKACFYATVTASNDELYSRMDVTIFFQKLSSEHKYATAKYSYYPSERTAAFKLESEHGHVLEACVSPGKYAITGVLYSSGVYGVTAYYGEYDRDFQPIEFDVPQDSNAYLGNFLLHSGRPQYFELRSMLERDSPIILEHTKKKPTSALATVDLDTGGNTWIRRE